MDAEPSRIALLALLALVPVTAYWLAVDGSFAPLVAAVNVLLIAGSLVYMTRGGDAAAPH